MYLKHILVAQFNWSTIRNLLHILVIVAQMEHLGSSEHILDSRKHFGGVRALIWEGAEPILEEKAILGV